MKATIGVYDTHEKALQAIKKLSEMGFSSRKLSILGKASMKDDHVHLTTGEPAKIAATEVGIGAVVGPVLGLLAGAGIFAIPGLGFLYGAGAIVGAIAGFDFGLIGGGLASALTILGMKKESAEEYEKHLAEGRFLLIAQGDEKELETAKNMLYEHGTHIHIGIEK